MLCDCLILLQFDIVLWWYFVMGILVKVWLWLSEILFDTTQDLKRKQV